VTKHMGGRGVRVCAFYRHHGTQGGVYSPTSAVFASSPPPGSCLRLRTRNYCRPQRPPPPAWTLVLRLCVHRRPGGGGYRGVRKNRTFHKVRHGHRKAPPEKNQHGYSHHSFSAGWLQDGNTKPVWKSTNRLSRVTVCISYQHDGTRTKHLGTGTPSVPLQLQPACKRFGTRGSS
jgi:hypothetical protein